MSKVYVNWYGRTLEGEVVDGSGFAGMTPVSIPLDGHHPVALFMPQHVFASADQVKGNFPMVSQNAPKVEAEPREISRIEPIASPKDWPTPEEYVVQVYVSTLVQQFKESHWDEAHNHLQTEFLEEFYQLWRKAHDKRPDESRYIVGADPGNPAGDVSVVLPLKTPPPPMHHKMRPKDVIRKNIVELSLFD